jgi:DNA primase
MTDIISVCEKLGISLGGNGNIKQALCPFHSERNPSFTVWIDTDSWYCFSCEDGGDVIELVRRHQNIGYRAALEWLGEDEPPARPQQRERRRTLPPEWLTTELVTHWHNRLCASGYAQDFLARRGIGLDLIADYELGCSDMIDGSIPPYMKDRVIIPYLNPYDDTVRAIKGRLLVNDDTPYKWRAHGDLSTPYNWERVVRRRPGHDTIIIVEAELDAILCDGILGRQYSADREHPGGWWSSLAMPAGQFRADLADCLTPWRVVLLADNDEAGHKTARKLGRIIAKLDVKYVPEGKDVGEFWQADRRVCEEWVMEVYCGA